MPTTNQKIFLLRRNLTVVQVTWLWCAFAFACSFFVVAFKAVIGDPGLAPSLGYFAGIPCLASFYWENLDGLHGTVRFYRGTVITAHDEIFRIQDEGGVFHRATREKLATRRSVI